MPELLQTALVEAVGPKGHRKARVLLDGGSDSSYIRSSLAEELGLSVVGTGTFSCIGFQEKTESARQYSKVRVELESRFSDRTVCLDMWSTDRLCSPLPTTPPPQMPSRLEMADDFEGGEIDLLIGVDNLYRVVLWEQIDLGEGLRAVETVFGYVLHGQKGETGPLHRQHHRTFHCRQVEVMWDLDTVGISQKDVNDSKPRIYPEPSWNEVEERYEMGLLWRSEERPASNRGPTLARTLRMSNRLSREKAVMYDAQIKSMLADAVVELSEPPKSSTGDSRKVGSTLAAQQVDSGDDFRESGEGSGEGVEQGHRLSPGPRDSEAFYLPHHGVLRNGKLRVVFDGSARDGVGRSLNEYLEPGDNLLAKLPSVLLIFRCGEIGCQADIQAAFHQVIVNREDRKYLQFFWSEMCLRFTRVPFGLTCSPFMLLRTVDIHLNRYAKSDEGLCDLIRDGSYMDDICLHFRDRNEAEKGMLRVKQMFAEAGMTLHKTRITGDQSSETSVLGLVWNSESDTLAVVVPEFSCPSTKRELLSALAKPFDPLGLLTPWLIGGKILFQRTWRDMPKAEWNDPLTTVIQAAVELWWKDTSGSKVFFPRRLLSNTDYSSGARFHVFCDASDRAYCAVIYAVCGRETGLVMAKSRLAPMNPYLTIPRLELMAALSGARLMTFVKESLKLQSVSVTYWTDSTDVLFWIRNKKPRKVFIQNRVTSILQLTEQDQWHHVRGTENPADLGTRGISLKAMKESERWWKGPSFLQEAACPTEFDKTLCLSPEGEREEKAEHCCPDVTPGKITLNAQQVDKSLFDITVCSSLKQVITRTAWIFRFVFNTRQNRSDRQFGPLTSEERCHALRFWIKEAQARAYEAELTALKSETMIPKGSPLLKLRPRFDVNGVLCAVPRTNESPLPILPEFAFVTTLIIEEAHQRCFHQGTRATLAILSAEYLIRRRCVLRVVSTCRRCRRYRGQSYRSADGGLPAFRVEPSRAFAKVGLDFFGPLVTDAGRKVWVLLITCATSRAVHLELVKSQQTEEVKLALRRFFAIRGTPTLILSDNARTFHALLSHIPRSVSWRFIPEAAPWWGGFWERLVGLTKKCLKITLHLCSLSHDELAATLYELAFHLNMRPLTTVDDEILTPAHLLFGVTSIKGVLTPSSDHCDYVTRAWRHQRRVSEHLIRRWTSEYVAALRTWSVSPRGRPKRVPAVGDVVLVQNEGPRGRWPLARVTGLIAGPDGEIRAAHVETRGTKTRRPLSRLFHLEAVTPNEP